MLRRKLLIIFGSLVILLAVITASAVWLLQSFLQKLDHMNTETAVLVGQASDLNITFTSIELHLYRLQLGRERHLDGLIDDVESARELIIAIGQHYVVEKPETTDAYRDLSDRFPDFERCVSSLATVQDAELAMRYNIVAMSSAVEMRKDVRHINHAAGRHAKKEQLGLARDFRWLMVGITLGGVFVINVSIIVLLRAAGMVLKPVDHLVETSRNLTREWSDSDSQTDQGDEFVELAKGYKTLALQLQDHEHRRMEVLHQMARTLNHELNNAIAAIKMQLQLLSRKGGLEQEFESGLRNIQEGLQRMTRTVESLKHIKRIVLTDYISGVKMLDLEQSIQGESDQKGITHDSESTT